MVHDSLLSRVSQVMLHNDTAIQQTEVEKVLLNTDK